MRWMVAVRRLVAVLALPSWFRGRHGAAMEAAFVEQLSVARRRGRAAVVFMVLRELADLGRAGVALRVRGRGAPGVSTVATPAASRGPAIWRGFSRDLAMALRGLRRRWRFSAIVVTTVAAAVAGAAAMFAVVHGVLLAPLPYPQPDRLAHVFLTSPELGWERGPVSFPNYADWREGAAPFSSLAAYQAGVRATVVSEGEPSEARGSLVSGEYFATLGVRPLLGRTLAAGDEGPSRPPVVVLSHRLWTERFGADPGVVGRGVPLGSTERTVVGVMPPEFAPAWAPAEFWLPLPLDAATAERDQSAFSVIGRLAAGWTLESARRWLEERTRAMERVDPAGLEGRRVHMESRAAVVAGHVRQPLLVLLGAVGVLLLVATANLAGLMMTAGVRRRRELAVRSALGAGRGRLVRELFAESLLLSLAGGALAVPLAAALIRGVVALAPADLPRREAIGLDPAVVAVALAAALTCALLFGLLPALRAARTRHADLRGGASDGADAGRPLRWLVIGQVAASVLLLAVAGLLLSSFLRLQAVDRGFDARGVLTFRLTPPESRYAGPDAVDGFWRGVTAELEAIPGVEAVGATWSLPLAETFGSSEYVVEGRPDEERHLLQLVPIRGDYLEAMGTGLLRGRGFRPEDAAAEAPPTIVNRALADRVWPDGDAVGQRLRKGEGEDPQLFEVVGVVEDVAAMSLGEPPRPQAFWPHAAVPWARSLFVVVRARNDPGDLVPAVRRAVARVDAGVPPADITTMADRVDRQLAGPRFRALLLAFFSAAALGLALLGIYGVVAGQVARRTREIGVRMALGARQGAVIRRVLGDAAGLAGLGLGIGVALAVAAGRLVQGLLFQVRPAEPALLAGIAAAVLAAALLAAGAPARRASRVDPATVLREE